MVSTSTLISLVPLFPLLGFLLIALNANRLSKGVTAVVASGAVLISFVISVVLFFNLLSLAPDQRGLHVELFTWIATGKFSASISFLVDPLSSLMLLIITGVGFLIHVYSIGYMHDDEGHNRFFSYLNLFVFFMLLLVMGSNYLLMFVGWEGVGLCSYLLIGFWFKNNDYTAAANKAFIMNRIGDLGLIVAVILIFVQFGSIEYSNVLSAAASAGGSEILTLITILLFVGAMGKSAQIPLYTWLPDAMAGPTPVSALIHAATMVTAGIYMVVRNNILYTLSPTSMGLILLIGIITALFAATIALVQTDIKKVLAYSTVSQLGLMFVALGLGAYTSGIFHMATHAFFKALLFLAAGSVIHGLQGEQDIRQMGGLRKYLPITYAVFFIGVLAISGIPPFAGFFSKDEILAKAFEHSIVIWALVLLTSLLTAFYMFRLLFLTFFGKARATAEVVSHIHESPSSMTIPLMALALLSVVGGLMGVPEVLGGNNALSNFLEPLVATSNTHFAEHASSHTTELGLMAIVVTLTIVMIVAAYVRYVSRKHVPAANEKNVSALQRTILHKYYIDELYEAIVVKPLFAMGEFLQEFMERLGIDGFVNGSGNGVVGASRYVRLLQTGNIGFYVFIMVIGIVLILSANLFL
ncbi:MAG: NADH-quinone oxidoreductase subunit L [Bacteroidetes bacterium]|nr:NADH-quinone oxidoreductase subunit L [Bacteroidota bacterium]